MKCYKKNKDEEPLVETGASNEILEEILELVRYQQKKLSSPDELFPPDYVRFVMNKLDTSKDVLSPKVIKDLEFSLVELDDFIGKAEEKNEEAISIQEIKRFVRKLERPIVYILRRYRNTDI